jgi:hypothetical protein
MLRALTRCLERASAIVTFNGKSFDWTLLRTRFVMNRMACPSPPPHIDLLHCSRRIFRSTFDELRLVTVERALLGHARTGDISGDAIPALYFRFVRNGREALLDPVLEHNALDLMSLAGLMDVLVERYRRLETTSRPSELLALAQLALRNKDVPHAMAFARAAAAPSSDRQTRFAAFTLVAKLARRQGDMKAALSSTLSALDVAADVESLEAATHLSLAKLFEHALRDHRRALEHARAGRVAEAPEVSSRRLERLAAKVAAAR